MEKLIYKGIEIWTGAAAYFIGLFKGNLVKDKWVYKMQTELSRKRMVAEQRSLQESGILPLDEIEIASFHKS